VKIKTNPQRLNRRPVLAFVMAMRLNSFPSEFAKEQLLIYLPTLALGTNQPTVIITVFSPLACQPHGPGKPPKHST
jgi:hypothetical protein